MCLCASVYVSVTVSYVVPPPDHVTEKYIVLSLHAVVASLHVHHRGQVHHEPLYELPYGTLDNLFSILIQGPDR